MASTSCGISHVKILGDIVCARKRVGVDKPDFPSLAAAAAATKTKKKKPQTLSLQEFTTYKPSQRIAAKGLTHNELLALPTGPRQRSAEELDHNKIGGGFKITVLSMNGRQGMNTCVAREALIGTRAGSLGFRAPMRPIIGRRERN
ncbi:hypothetical protein Fot_25179 [Forsythia ovata]|uniref:Ribosomal protein S11 n=1 Tax=Forsythia ovata TaxID=205694 RepID=A0ABD1U8D8_9LAMI